MFRISEFAVLACALLALAPAIASATPWGESYFPNVSLTTQDGESVLFFDDLIKDRIVAINFIYTTCPDSCPLETAQLVKVQSLLGDRLGRDVFFYSISIDPETDTPEALKAYRERFGARWTFLTGENADITLLRRKLGLYIEEIQDGSNNHNVSMIIGNQATGRWMKRSPFENPYVLADQIGNWLSGWKSVQPAKDYAEAPELRSIPLGEQLFRTRCATCHTVTGREEEGALGPDLLGVTQRREMNWLLNWLRAPDRMLANKDPIAMELFEQYKQLPMPNLRLNPEEALALLDYMEDENNRLAAERLAPSANSASTQQPGGDVVAVMNAWVRETDAAAKVHAGYMTLINVSDEDVTLAGIDSDAYDAIEVHEMAVVDGLMEMRQLTDLVIPARGQVQLAPGGMHLMLMGPRQHFSAGRRLDMVLRFSSGARQSISVKVAARYGY